VLDGLDFLVRGRAQTPCRPRTRTRSIIGACGVTALVLVYYSLAHLRGRIRRGADFCVVDVVQEDRAGRWQEAGAEIGVDYAV
jgi:hypothetical protein